ncbi:hypothetical protein ABIB82_000546 [Bradyrhizobium sp. i1.8.4]
MPENSGSPTIGRLASDGFGFLLSTCGHRINRVAQAHDHAADAAAAFADLDAGIARLGLPDAERLRRALRVRGGHAKSRRNDCDHESYSARHDLFPNQLACITSRKISAMSYSRDQASVMRKTLSLAAEPVMLG